MLEHRNNKKNFIDKRILYKIFVGCILFFHFFTAIQSDFVTLRYYILFSIEISIGLRLLYQIIAACLQVWEIFHHLLDFGHIRVNSRNSDRHFY